VEAASDLIRCEVASLWKLRLRPLNVQVSNGAEHTTPSWPIRLGHSLDAGSVCRRSGRPGRNFRTSVRRKRFAGDARVSLQPKRPRRKASLRTREKSGPRFSKKTRPRLQDRLMKISAGFDERRAEDPSQVARSAGENLSGCRCEEVVIRGGGL